MRFVQSGPSILASRLEALNREMGMVSENPHQFAFTYHARGKAQLEGKNFATAIAEFGEALGRDPAFAEAYHLRGLAYAETGELDRAIADLTEAIRLNRKEPGPFHDRGVVYCKNLQADLALADFNAALQREPRAAMTYFSSTRWPQRWPELADSSRPPSACGRPCDSRPGNSAVRSRDISPSSRPASHFA